MSLLTKTLKRSFAAGYAIGRIHGYVDTLDELLGSDDPLLREAGARISPFIATGAGRRATP